MTEDNAKQRKESPVKIKESSNKAEYCEKTKRQKVSTRRKYCRKVEKSKSVCIVWYDQDNAEKVKEEEKNTEKAHCMSQK